MILQALTTAETPPDFVHRPEQAPCRSRPVRALPHLAAKMPAGRMRQDLAEHLTLAGWIWLLRRRQCLRFGTAQMLLLRLAAAQPRRSPLVRHHLLISDRLISDRMVSPALRRPQRPWVEGKDQARTIRLVPVDPQVEIARLPLRRRKMVPVLPPVPRLSVGISEQQRETALPGWARSDFRHRRKGPAPDAQVRGPALKREKQTLTGRGAGRFPGPAPVQPIAAGPVAGSLSRSQSPEVIAQGPARDPCRL